MRLARLKTIATCSMIACLLASIVLSGCTALSPQDPGNNPQAQAANPAIDCPITEPEWLTHPEDSAVLNEPAPGYYYVNQDRSMWASAYWSEEDDYPLRAGEDGNKVGWFRPEGAELEISGQRIDGEAPAFEAHIPCCYPTRFQSSGLYFPTAGCWEIHASAAESKLSFTVWVEP